MLLREFPPTILLGMTFPLMSSAVIRRRSTDAAGRSASGHHLAMLYFTNSIGAAAGALASAFWLIGSLGLPGTMQLDGKLNLLLACVVYWYARLPEVPPTAVADGARRRDPQRQLFLWAAFVTGAASFIYEIAWTRMLAIAEHTLPHLGPERRRELWVEASWSGVIRVRRRLPCARASRSIARSPRATPSRCRRTAP